MNKETNNKNDELLLQTLADALGPRPLTDDEILRELETADAGELNDSTRQRIVDGATRLIRRSPQFSGGRWAIEQSADLNAPNRSEIRMHRIDKRNPRGNQNPRGAVAALVVAAMSLIGVLFWTAGESDRQQEVVAQRETERQNRLQTVRQQWMTARYVPAVSAPLVEVGDVVTTNDRERRRVILPDGSALFLNESTTVNVMSDRRVKVDAGEVFVEVVPHFEAAHRDKFEVVTPTRTVTALGTKFGVDAEGVDTEVLVTQGKVKVSGVGDVVSAGQELVSLDDGDNATPQKTRQLTALPAMRASEHLSWTRELMVTSKRLVPASEHAGGSIISVDPDGQEMKLSLRKYHVDVHIEDGFARTTIDQTYFNHTQQRLEGTFRFPLPSDASLSRLAMYVGKNLMEGGMAERQHARNTFEKIVHKMKDPALLEWVDGSTFKMRVFPLEAREEKRIVLSYTQRLNTAYGKTYYRFPAGHSMDSVREWSTSIKLANAKDTAWHSPSHKLSETKEGGGLVLAASEKLSRMDRDLVLELGPASPVRRKIAQKDVTRWSSASDGRHRYLMLRYQPDLPGEAKRKPRHWVFLFEASADRNPVLARGQIEIIRTLLDNAEHTDTFNIVTANSEATAFSKQPLNCTRRNVRKAVAHLEQTHLVGALDLQKAWRKCADLAVGEFEAMIVHTGSAIPVLGHQEYGKLLADLPDETPYVGVGVGKLWSRNLMKEAAGRTGGYFTQINPDEEVSWRAFELSSLLNTPRLLDVSVASSSSEASPFLNFADTIAQGEEVCAVARFTSEKDVPKSVTVSGRLKGKPWKRTVKVRQVVEKADYIPRSWAKLQIDRLLADREGNHKSEIIRLSKSMYVMSPYTSLLVLENEAMYTQHNIDRGRDDHWALYDCPKTIEIVREPIAAPKAVEVVDAATLDDDVLDNVRWLSRPQLFSEAQVVNTPSTTSYSLQLSERMPTWGVEYDHFTMQHHYPYYTIRGPQDFTLGESLEKRLDLTNLQESPVILWGRGVNGPGNSPRRPQSKAMNAQQSSMQVEQNAAEMIELYNELMHNDRLAEAELVALRFRDRHPDAVQGEIMATKAKLKRQIAEIEAMKERKESKSLMMLNSVDANSWTSLDRGRRRQRLLQELNGRGSRLTNDELFRRIAEYEMAYRMPDVNTLSRLTPAFGEVSKFNRWRIPDERQKLLFGASPNQQQGQSLSVPVEFVENEDSLVLRGNPSDIRKVELMIADIETIQSRLSTYMKLPAANSKQTASENMGQLYLSFGDPVRFALPPSEALLSMSNSVQTAVPFYGWPGGNMDAWSAHDNGISWTLDNNGDGILDSIWLDVPRYGDSNSGRTPGGWRYQPYQPNYSANWHMVGPGRGYAGPFYPYQNGTLGWSKIPLSWDDGHWQLDFKSVELEQLKRLREVPQRFAQPFGNTVQFAPAQANSGYPFIPGLQPNGDSLRSIGGANLKYFGDVISHAPGLNTSVADVLSLVDQQESDAEDSATRKVEPSNVDAEARTLIERARSRGWERITFPNSEGAAPFVVFCDGAGRHSYERVVSEGLQEKVLCDGTVLRHVYADIGLAAKRDFSVHHRREIESLVPWLLPSTKTLARNADIVLVADNTVAIIPNTKDDSLRNDDDDADNQVDDDGALSGQSGSGDQSKSQPVFETHLVFGKQGRLTERRLVVGETNDVIFRTVFAADGTVRLFDGDDQELAVVKLKRESVPAPDLNPDVSDLVVLPLPIRSSQSLLKKKDDDTVDPNFSGYSRDELLALILADAAENNGARAVHIIHEQFFRKGDRRDGFYVLLSRYPDLLVWEEGVPGSEGRKRQVDLRPSAEGSPLRQFLRQYITWQRNRTNAASQLSPLLKKAADLYQRVGSGHADAVTVRQKIEHLRRQRTSAPLTFQGFTEFEIDGSSESFVHRLATACNVYHRWSSGKATKDRTKSQIRNELKSALKVVATCHTEALGWRLLSVIRPRIATVEQNELFARAAEKFEDSVVLALAAREERVRALFGADKNVEARKLFVQFVRANILRGSLPQIDPQIYEQFVEDEAGKTEWNELTEEIGAAFRKAKQLRARLVFSMQLRNLGDVDGASRLLDDVLADLKPDKHPDVTLLAVHQLHQLKNVKANSLLDALFEQPPLRKSARLWRYAAHVADDLGKKQVALDRTEQAVLLEFENRPDMINVETLRVSYTDLMDRFEAVIDASETLEVDYPENLFARIVRAADQWRSLEDDPTECCHRTADLLQKINRNDLSWQYLTTPLIGRSGESEPWHVLAKRLSAQKQVSRADKAFEKAFAYEQTNPQILLDHAFMLDRNNQHGRAMKLYRKIADSSWTPKYNKVQLQARDQLR